MECRSEERHLLMCEASAPLFQHAAMAENERVRLFSQSLIHPGLHERLFQPCRVLKRKRQACEMYRSVLGRLGA